MNKFPNKKYKIIYADPPWSYTNKSIGKWNGGAASRYDTMELEQIKELPIKIISEKDSCLFMWAVVPQLPEAFEVMESWGFKYKTMITWHKILPQFGGRGMGYWFRGQTEHLLFGIKGNVKAFRSIQPNHYNLKLVKHSKKPHIFRQVIEKATPKDWSRIELFARTRIHGWDTWGNDEKLQAQPLESFYDHEKIINK